MQASPYSGEVFREKRISCILAHEKKSI